MVRLTIWFLVINCLVGCAEVEDALKKIDNSVNEETLFTLPPGVEATAVFAKASSSLQTDISGVLAALQVGIKETGNANLVANGFLLEEDTTLEVTSEGAKILEKIRSAKKSHNPDSFLENSSSFFEKSNGTSLLATDYSTNTITWDAAVPDDYTIPVLNKMPTRNQGQRGTCAAFAGIGQIEGYVLQNSDLDFLDLSEQRFYAMSKPDHWSTGGDVNSGGSNSGDGFGKSYFKTVTYGDQTSPTEYNIADTYNIPLESKCPYVSELSTNDIQSPGTKSDGCATGVVQVQDFTSWFYQWDKQLGTAQSIYDFLRDKKYPVIVFSKLTDNWEYNDGIITLAGVDTSGDSSHASGHAYLVVGMKKLSEAEYPGEGGMCFYIKNSWGKGWGVNGMSCMTLAWFNKYRYQTEFPTVLDLAVDATTLSAQVKEEETKPDNTTEPDEETKTIDYDNQTPSRPRGKISFSTDISTKLASDYTFGKLINNEDEFSKVFYRVDGESFYLRGLLADGKTQTHDMKLQIDAASILYSDFEGNGLTAVGSLDDANKTVTLCSQDYSEKCHFNYLEASNEILVGIAEAELLRDDSEGPYDWTYLGAAGQGIELSFPDGFSTKVDARFAKDSVVTNPLRFRIKPIDGGILYQGQEVGNYQSGELCSGDYKNFCRVVRTTEQFLITFKSKKG